MKSTASSTKGANKMVSVYSRSGKLYLKYFVNEKRVRKSTRLDDTVANRTFLETSVIPKIEAKISLGLFEPEKKRFKFEDITDKYLDYKSSLKTYSHIYYRVRRILSYFDNKYIDEIKRGDIRQFIHDMLTTQNKKPKTVRDYLHILSGIFDVAIDDELIRDNPAHNHKLPEHHRQVKEPFTPTEVELILENIEEEWFKNLVAVGFYTGMRTGEIIGLMRQDIDLDQKVIHVRRSVSGGRTHSPKTKTSVRTIPLFDVLIPYLKEQMEATDSEFLFVSTTGKPFTDPGNVSKRRWNKLLDELKLKRRQLYTTRHTFITTMLKSGKFSIMEIAKIVGHSNSTMIMRNYAQFIEGEQLKINRGFDLYS